MGGPHARPLSTGDSGSAAQYEMVLRRRRRQAMLPLCHTHSALGHLQKVSSSPHKILCSNIFRVSLEDVMQCALLGKQTMNKSCFELWTTKPRLTSYFIPIKVHREKNMTRFIPSLQPSPGGYLSLLWCLSGPLFWQVVGLHEVCVAHAGLSG